MTISATAARESLARHASWLKPSVHEDLINGLRADGLIHDDGAIHAVAHRFPSADDVDPVVVASAARGLRKLTPAQVHAAAAQGGNQNLIAAFNRVRAQSAKYEIELGDSLLDVHEVDRKLKSANVDLETRMRYKASLHFLKLI